MEEQFKEIIIKGNRKLSLKDCQLLHQFAQEIKPKILVEIGSADGVSSLLLGIIARDNVGHLYCVEPHPTQRWWNNIKEYKLLSWITLIRAQSPWVNFLLYTHEKIDFLFIDGDHRLRWVLIDYHYWFPFVKVGGYIAFHDVHEKKEVNQAINIILQNDKDKLEQIGITTNTTKKGVIIFKKIKN